MLEYQRQTGDARYQKQVRALLAFIRSMQRDDGEFAHLINLPMQLEETIRDTVMSFILDQLGVTQDPDEFPTVIVFIVSGGALTAQPEQVLEGLKKVLRDHCGEAAAEEWQGVLSRLIAEESAMLQSVSTQELNEALKGDSPDYFTLWENRN